MENFNLLVEMISTFNINAVEYNNCTYMVIRDTISTDSDFYEKIYKANWELLALPSDIALNKVTFLRGLIAELKDFDKNMNNNFDALQKFYEIRGKLLIKYTGPSFLDYKKLVITQNLIDDLKEEIEVRGDIIEKFEDALNRSKGIEPKKAGINMELSDRFKRAIDNNLMPNELTIIDWDEIRQLDDIYVAIDQKNVSAVDGSQLDTTSNARGDNAPDAIPPSINAGFESYLNEPDLIQKLNSYKHLNSPQKITLMVFALKELGKLKSDPIISATILHRALSESFGEVGTREAIRINLLNYTKSPLPPGRALEISSEKQIVSKLISL